MRVIWSFLKVALWAALSCLGIFDGRHIRACFLALCRFYFFVSPYLIAASCGFTLSLDTVLFLDKELDLLQAAWLRSSVTNCLREETTP
jgi:hypothetical protein